MSKVEVSVINGNVTVDKEKLSMVGKGRNAPIQWILKTNGWTFPSNGIVIHDNDGQFSDLGPVESGKTFKCVDHNNDAKIYKYDINVSNGQTTLTLDPTIENGAQQ